MKPSRCLSSVRCRRSPRALVRGAGVPVGRLGVTLSEVLVSILVMSIGVVAVATLFPLSVLRTIQATQLTNATQLKYNFEGLVGAKPEVLNGTAAWRPLWPYSEGDLVVSASSGNRFFECRQNGTSGSVEPAWNLQAGGTTNDGGTAWSAHPARVFLVDPLGWEFRTEELRDRGQTPARNTADLRNTFGRQSLTGTTLTVDSRFRIVRFRGGNQLTATDNPNPSNSVYFPAVGTAAEIATRGGARELAVMPDSWVEQGDTTDFRLMSPTQVQTVNETTKVIATLDRDGDNQLNFLRGIGAEQEMTARVTLYSQDNRTSVTRVVTTATIPTAGREEYNWSAPLPTGFVPVRVRIESFEQRYSWAIAGRRQDSGALYANVIVFFRRSTDAEDELIHPAHFFVGTQWPGADGNPAISGPGAADNRILNSSGRVTTPTASSPATVPAAIIQYNTALGADQKPALRRGGYICDAQNNRWYRITRFDEVSDVDAVLTALDGTAGGALTGRGAVVLLESAILEASGRYGPTGGPGGAILLPGIVDVYPLQPNLPWE